LFPADPFSGPSYPSSKRPGSLEARPDAVANQRTLELPDGRHDVEDQLASRGRGVDVLFDRDKSHAAPTQVVKSRDELLDRASRAVEPLDDDGLKLSRAASAKSRWNSGRFSFAPDATSEYVATRVNPR